MSWGGRNRGGVFFIHRLGVFFFAVALSKRGSEAKTGEKKTDMGGDCGIMETE